MHLWRSINQEHICWLNMFIIVKSKLRVHLPLSKDKVFVIINYTGYGQIKRIWTPKHRSLGALKAEPTLKKCFFIQCIFGHFDIVLCPFLAFMCFWILLVVCLLLVIFVSLRLNYMFLCFSVTGRCSCSSVNEVAVHELRGSPTRAAR